MKKNYFSFLLISFLLATFTASGEEIINLTTQDKSYTIDKGGIYHFTTESKEWLYDIIVTAQDPVTIILDNINIKSDVPLNLQAAKDVTIELIGGNILDNSGQTSNYAAITAPNNIDGKLVFSDKSSGHLKAISNYGAGIGWSDLDDFTNQEIIINGGKITAISYLGAGIGGSIDGFGNITINGGKIIATSTKGAAIGLRGTIGSLSNRKYGVITITGGIIQATSTNGVGIGYSSSSDVINNNNIIIIGGTITAISEKDFGIGFNAYNNNGTFKTSKDGILGNAVLITNSIDQQLSDQNLSGIIFLDNIGKVYGSPTIQTDATIPKDATLTINEGQVLTIDEGITLTNEGSINNKGTIKNYGILIGNSLTSGTVDKYYYATLNTNDGKESLYNKLSCKENEDTSIPFDNLPTRQYYTFLGWNTDRSATTATYTKDNNKLSISSHTTLYAIWKPNTFTVNGTGEQKLTYKQKPISYDLSELLDNDAEKNCGTITYMVKVSSTLPSGLSLDGSIIKGSPNIVNASEVEVAITATAANTSSQEIKVIFFVDKAELTITPIPNQIIYEGDIISYNVSTTATENVPKFNGELAANDKKIVQGNLALTDEATKNYSIKFISDVSVNVCAGKAEDAEATTQATEGQDGWSTSNITIIPPADFQIALVSFTILKNSLDYKNNLIWETEGNHTLTYSLQRKSRSGEFKHTISVKLDKTPPALSYTTDKLNYTLTFSDAGSGIDELFVDGAKVTQVPDATTYTTTGTAGAHTARVTDKAGLSKEISFELVDGGSIVPDPVPEPEPDPVYYDVTLPETEGVVFSPAAGTYPVEEYSSFSFSVTVAEGYREQSVPVVKVNGNVFDPVDDDGHYKIKFIRSDQSVTVEGILADNPTANETLGTPAFKLRTEGHTLCITVAQPRLCRLFDPSGRLICSRQLTPGINRLEGLAAGIYFVVVEREGVRKIVVQ